MILYSAIIRIRLPQFYHSLNHGLRQCRHPEFWRRESKWNLLARPWRFNELRRDLEGISQKVLTDSLRSMEADGIIIRTVFPEVPPRVEYALSELGESMRPIIKAMEQWGLDYKAKFKDELKGTSG